MNCWFQPQIKNSDHVMKNISWLQFAAQLSKFFKSSKFEAHPINLMDSAASVELFSVTYIELYLARKCKTLK